MRYVKKWCPKCGNVIQQRSIDNTTGTTRIGIPFITCPQCNEMLIEKKCKEVNMLTINDYIIIWFWNIFYSSFSAFILSGVLSVILSNFFDIFERNFALTFIGFFIIVFMLLMYNYYNIFQKEKHQSEERLEDDDYYELCMNIKNNFYDDF